MLLKESIHHLLFKPSSSKQNCFHLDTEHENNLEIALSLFFDFGKQQKLLVHFKDDETINLALGCSASAENKTDLGKLPHPFFGGSAFSSSLSSESIWKDIPNTYFFHPKLLISLQKKKVLIQSFAKLEELEELFETETVLREEKLSLSPLLEEKNWEERIQKGIEDIRRLDIGKIVLSSYAELSISSTRVYIETLFKKNTNCHHFLFEKDESLIFSFSPETLLKLNQSQLSTVAMAGSVLDEEADELLYSKKIVEENTHVVNYLKEVLTPSVENLEISEQKIAKLHNIKHLYHDLSARLKPTVNPLDLLFSLYPTPALCGVPKDKSMIYIEKNEPFKRMWYGGALGMLSEETFHFMVGIRLGVICQNKARLYAGAGLTKDSIFSTECEEIRRKMLFGQI